MTDFETWFNELISDTRWYEVTAMHNKGKNFKLAAQRVYADTVAEGNQGFSKPMAEFRKHVYNKLVRMDFDRIFPALQQETKEEVKEDWKPVSEEERQRRLKEWQEVVNNSCMINAMPRLTAREILENGGWKPAKIQPRSDIEKVMIVEEYIKRARQARAKVFKSYYPDASEEEVEAYCDKFSDV